MTAFRRSAACLALWWAAFSTAAVADSFEQCLAGPEARLIGFDAQNQPIVAAQSGVRPRRRTITADQRSYSVPDEVTVPIIRSAGARGGVLLLRDNNGDERYSLAHQTPPPAAQAVQLSPIGGRVASPLALNTSADIIFTSTPGQGQLWGVLRAPLQGPPRIVFQEPGAWQAVDSSADGKRLLLMETFGLYDRILFVLDLTTGLKMPVFLGQRPMALRGAAFGASNNIIYVILVAGAQNSAVIRADTHRGEARVIYRTDWPLYAAASAPQANQLAVLENVNGQSVLHQLTLGADAPVAAKRALGGWAYDLTYNAPGTTVGLTLEKPGIAPKPLLISASTATAARNDAACAPAALSAIEIKRLKPFAGIVALPAFLLEPVRARNTPRPVLIAFHGGPEGQWRRSSLLEYFALADTLDIAILFPNVAGSTGYGLAYAAADDAANRRVVINDVALILDWIAATPRLDAAKVASFGASYGGYLALLAQSQFNDRLSGAVSEVGITDLPSFLRETPITRRSLRRAEYGDERDEDLAKQLTSLSPLGHVTKITKPIFLVHGVNDARVPVNQSTNLAAALRAQGTPVIYKPLPNEGHIIRDVQTRLTLARDKAAFLKDIFKLEDPASAKEAASALN